MTFNRADILLPCFGTDSEKMKKWSVVACDQYTSEPEYWNAVKEFVGKEPSALNLTVPEIYLSDADISERIKGIGTTMEKYLSDGVFTEHKNTFVFVERTLASGAKRLGIVGKIDLEDYDYSADSQTKVRATEGTVVSRIPPRLRVRENAPVELPHIMLLIDDRDCDIIEANLEMKNGFEVLYDFDLMQNSGHITGYKMSEEASALLEKKLSALDDTDKFRKKYGVENTSALIYAMGDGNHSLATAKAHYENLKKTVGVDAAKSSPARYALCELVNLHDSSLVFEAIHRTVFGADAKAFLALLESHYDVSYEDGAKGQSFILVHGGKDIRVTVKDPKEYLTVATVQKALDEFISVHGGELDYIHGEDVVRKLCCDDGNFGIILDAMEKTDLYKSVILDGALPRKTFSMGDACDKRFYIEARAIK